MKSTRRFLVVAAVVLGLALASFGIAYAITYGEPDGDGHPYVGLVVFYDGDDVPMWRCSGTLLSPTVLLTAGHCTSGPASAQVWFDPDVSGTGYPLTGGVTGTPIPHLDYDDYWSEFPNTYDVGVVILDDEVDMDEYGELPKLGVLDDLATRRGRKDVILRTVGYGYQSVKPVFQADLVRYTSTSMLVNLRSALTDGYNLHTSNNPGKGQGTGGSCFGDSGGPIFYPEGSNVVVAVVSFGMNWNCKGADWGYRTDIVDAQEFINPFLQ